MPIRSLKGMQDAPQFAAAFPNAIPEQLLVNVDDDEAIAEQRGTIVTRLQHIVECGEVLQAVAEQLGMTTSACRELYFTTIEQVLDTIPEPAEGEERVVILKVIQYEDDDGTVQMKALRPARKNAATDPA